MRQHHKDAGSLFILNTQKVKHQRANTHTNTLRLKRHPVISEKQTQSGLRSEIYSHFRTSDICSPVQIPPQVVLVFQCVYSLVCPPCTMQSKPLVQFVMGVCVVIFLISWDDILFAHVYPSLMPCVFPKYTSPALMHWFTVKTKLLAQSVGARERERGCVSMRSGQWAIHMHLNDVREIPWGNHLSTSDTHTQTNAQTFA